MLFETAYEYDVKSKEAAKVFRTYLYLPSNGLMRLDHAFESSTTIKVVTMQILWPSSLLWKVQDPVTKELCNHFDGEL